MVEYKPYELMHYVFGEPTHGSLVGFAEIRTYDGDMFIAEAHKVNDGFAFKVGKLILAQGESVEEAVSKLNYREISFDHWKSCYDSEFAKVQDDGVWAPEFLVMLMNHENKTDDVFMSLLESYKNQFGYE